MRVRILLALAVGVFAGGDRLVYAQTAIELQRSGADLYRAACSSCHGPDGKGAPQRSVGFDIPLPDFSDCRFASPEADVDWTAVIADGGPVRGFDRIMPAFGDALSRDEIARIVDHTRSFCADEDWPRGDLNLPRPLVTEKAFPENEAVATTTVARGDAKSVVSEFLFERRLGKRGQWELAIPFALQQAEAGDWQQGLGDIAVAYKHVIFASLPRGAIVSAGSELVLPTGKETHGWGTSIFEPFGVWSQMLPRDGFLHLHAGFEFPFGSTDTKSEAFWRAALGKTFVVGRWGRSWAPMVEVLGARELTGGERATWDVVPQMQVSLSRRQHVLVNAGIRVPITERETRRASVVLYLLWDWFDGGLLSGW